MFIRRSFFIVMSLMLAAMLTGCMGSADENGESVNVTLAPVVTAEATGLPGSQNRTDFDWRAQAESVEDAIEQLSEIADARVAIAGTTALVGVEFDDAYKGEMTDRIREMVAGVVKKADPGIEMVAVTAAVEDVKAIFDMSDRVRAGEAFEDFREDINSIVRKSTTRS